MHVPAIPSVGDSGEHLATEVFTYLSRCILAEESDPLRAEARLWSLPEIAVNCALAATAGVDLGRDDLLIHRLRLIAGETINTGLDRSAAREALAGRARAAAQSFVLRPWTLDDAPVFSSLLDNPRVWAQLRDSYPGVVSEELASQLITASNAASERHLVRAATWQGGVVGQVRLQFDSSPHRDSAEISYWLGEPFWCRGWATGLVTLFTARSFESMPELQRIFALVLEGHGASLRVLQKAGYRHESFELGHVVKDGERLGLHCLGVCRQDYAF